MVVAGRPVGRSAPATPAQSAHRPVIVRWPTSAMNANWRSIGRTSALVTSAPSSQVCRHARHCRWPWSAPGRTWNSSRPAAEWLCRM